MTLVVEFLECFLRVVGMEMNPRGDLHRTSKIQLGRVSGLSDLWDREITDIA